jgi:hypothetical protein
VDEGRPVKAGPTVVVIGACPGDDTIAWPVSAARLVAAAGVGRLLLMLSSEIDAAAAFVAGMKTVVVWVVRVLVTMLAWTLIE